MAKRVRASDLARSSNGYDGEKLKNYIGKIEGYSDEIESSKAQHMNRCRHIRGSMDVVFEEAKALGIPKKVLKAHVDLRLLERKKRNVVEKLGDDDVETFEAMADALGDFATLPLGEAAVKRKAANAADLEALATLN